MLEARDLASGVIGRLQTKLAGLSGGQKVLAAGFGAAALGGVAAAYEIAKFADHSVKAAASFQQANTLLVTQAGVARSRIQALTDDFLTLAPKLAQTPLALSQGFYHVASALGKFGFSTARELNVLKAAAMGAAIGNANLEDTTNSLVGALASGVGGIHGARDAMATILAIVGAGNMRLQQFNAAMGTGLPGAAKTFGVSMQSVGAALAYLTDTGMGAQMAATRLTMAIALMGAPSAHSAKLLHAIGLASSDFHTRFPVVTMLLQKAGLSFSQLAVDMKKPDGIVVALQDLKTHMEQAGMSANLQSALIARAFGGGHMGKAIMQIFEELPRVSDSFNRINASVSGFGQHWKDTTQNAIFQAKSLHGATSAISTAIGEALLPAVQKLLAALVPVVAKVADWTTKHKTLAAVMLGSAFALAILTAVVGTLSLAFLALDAAATPWLAIGAAIVAGAILTGVAIYEVAKHFQTWGKWAMIAIQQVAGPLFTLAVYVLRYWEQIVKFTRQAWEDISGFLVTTWNRIIALAEMSWGNWRDWLTTLWGDILAAMFGAWNNVIAFYQNLWGTIKSDVVTAWTDVLNWFKALPGKILGALGSAGNWLLNLGSDAIGGLWQGMKDAASAVWSWLSGAGTTAANAVTGAASWLYGMGSKALGGLWQGMKDEWDTVSGWLASTGGRIANAVVGAAEWLYAHGKSALGGLWQGMKDVWDTVSGWLASTGGRVANAVVGAGKWLYDHGKSAIQGLWDGMVALFSGKGLTVENWLGHIGSMIAQYFKNAGKWLWDAGVSIIQGLWDGLKQKWQDVVSWLSGLRHLIPNLKGPIEKDRLLLQPQGAAIIQGLAAGMQSQLGMLKGTLGGVTSGIVGTVGGAAVGVTPVPAATGGGQVVININEPHIVSPNDVTWLTDLIGTKLATFTLPSSGMQVRRR